jgi:hypothetical protein
VAEPHQALRDPAGEARSGAYRLAGWLLAIFGGLWSAVSVLGLVGMIAQLAWSGRAGPPMLPLVFSILGLLPGLLFMLAGWAMLRRQTPERNPQARTLGYLFLTVGALWTLTTGGCTSVVVIMGLLEKGDALSQGIAVMTLIVGAVLVLPGLLLLWAGRAMLRRNPKRA